MKARVLAVFLTVLVSACVGGETIDSSSTTAVITETSLTTLAPSSSSSTTTSPTIPPTTSTTLLDGNWADLPVITSTVWSMVLGWWDGSQWVPATDGVQVGVDGGEDYQVALMGSSGIVQGGPQVRGCFPPGDHPGIELSDPAALSTSSGSEGPGHIRGVAISAGWEITPRPVTQGEAHPDLEAIAAHLLRRAGYETESAKLVQVIDADLDDDGAMETIVVAEDTELGNSVSDVYSIVFVVTPIAADPLVVESSVIPADQEGFPASFRVGAVADLNGDGNMEIVLNASAWEGTSVAVFESTDDGFTMRLIVSCGA